MSDIPSTRNNPIVPTHGQDVVALEDTSADLLDALRWDIVHLLNQGFTDSVNPLKEIDISVDVDKRV
jgi:hypothetical protein